MKKVLTILFIVISCNLVAQEHPYLILTKPGVAQMKSARGKTPLFDVSFEKVKEEVDAEILKGIEVPVPKDLAGGYTHSRHKANFFIMQKAGVLFQVTEDEKYAIYIRDMLLEYARIFPTFEMHPEPRSYATGKFFWQCLNDANWLVYTSQAYDAIYDWLDTKTVKKLNKELFRPYAEFISIQNSKFFNRVHNHSTWGNAGVGMIALVMGDQELLQWALYGLGDKASSVSEVDNDGGSIEIGGKKAAGFFAQLDHSFSPEGYYTEGPYYQRYAIYPFLIFSQALANKKPELKILNYRDNLLIKAVYTLIDLSNSNGEFFPINDALKGMTLSSRELVTAISMAYYYGDKDARLLSLIENQGRVPLNVSGIAAANDIAKGLAKPYVKTSRLFFDGENGDEGAVGILRSTPNSDITLLMKYAKHGMGHGHFDRLGFMLYDGKHEVFQDYGSARWVNIKHKDGGGYLKENTSWAKQTVAHNSIVIDDKSQFDGKVKLADITFGTHILFDTIENNAQVISAKEEKAYSDWKIIRTMAMLEIPELEKPLILDLVHLIAKKPDALTANIELPFYYVGEFMSSNLEIKSQEVLKPMGDKFGFQHLWKEGEAKVVEENNFKMTWFNGSSFYSLTAEAQKGDKVYFTRIGANDPHFNLRRDPGIIYHRNSSSTAFAQVYEMHGSYDSSTEIPENLFTSIKQIKTVVKTKEYSAVEINLESGESYYFCIKNDSADKQAKHTLKINGSVTGWTGPYYFFKNTTK